MKPRAKHFRSGSDNRRRTEGAGQPINGTEPASRLARHTDVLIDEPFPQPQSREHGRPELEITRRSA
jgi:hypothetical protein